MERTVDPFRALKHQIEEVRPKITERENEIVEWKGVAEQLARANAHLMLDTPGAVDEALEEMRIALWQARFELANRKPADQKLTGQKWREFIHDLDAAQRKLHTGSTSSRADKARFAQGDASSRDGEVCRLGKRVQVQRRPPKSHVDG